MSVLIQYGEKPNRPLYIFVLLYSSIVHGRIRDERITLCEFSGETRMRLSIFRKRLRADAALGLGVEMAPTQAQADCVVSPPGTPVGGTVTCADTVTSDTT